MANLTIYQPNRRLGSGSATRQIKSTPSRTRSLGTANLGSVWSCRLRQTIFRSVSKLSGPKWASSRAPAAKQKLPGLCSRKQCPSSSINNCCPDNSLIPICSRCAQLWSAEIARYMLSKTGILNKRSVSLPRPVKHNPVRHYPVVSLFDVFVLHANRFPIPENSWADGWNNMQQIRPTVGIKPICNGPAISSSVCWAISLVNELLPIPVWLARLTVIRMRWINLLRLVRSNNIKTQLNLQLPNLST